MSHITPCEVRVEDAGKRQELKKWLESEGYLLLIYTTRPLENDSALFTGARIILNESLTRWDDRYDCGEDVDLFKALAAINTDNDRNQWFVFDRDVYDKVDEFESGDVPVAKQGEFYFCRDNKMIGT